MTQQHRDTLADWLDLHGLTGVDCEAILDAAPPPQSAGMKLRNIEIGLSAGEVLELATTRLIDSLPAGSRDAVVAELQTVRIIIDAEKVKSLSGALRPLTVEDGGDGKPVILCPYQGRLRDALALAHEIAHALQYVRADAFVPPVLRELFAFLGEHALVDALQGAGHPGAPQAAAHWQHQDGTFLATHAAILRDALGQPKSAYDYRWNYALARALFHRAAAPDAAALRLRLADGPKAVSEVLKTS